VFPATADYIRTIATIPTFEITFAAANFLLIGDDKISEIFPRHGGKIG
jgi:hypothetical protein